MVEDRNAQQMPEDRIEDRSSDQGLEVEESQARRLRALAADPHVASPESDKAHDDDTPPPAP